MVIIVQKAKEKGDKGNGVYLFPDFSFENPAFEAI